MIVVAKVFRDDVNDGIPMKTYPSIEIFIKKAIKDKNDAYNYIDGLSERNVFVVEIYKSNGTTLKQENYEKIIKTIKETFPDVEEEEEEEDDDDEEEYEEDNSKSISSSKFKKKEYYEDENKKNLNFYLDKIK